MSQPPNDAWAGDVLVIGAGMAGALCALKLRERGLKVTLLESDGFGAGQSNHSHGYLHSGYVYVNGGSALARELVLGAQAWRNFMEQADIAPVTETSTVAFASPLAAQAARRTWAAAGLRIGRAALPPSIDRSELSVAYGTPEPSYDFTRALEHLARRLKKVPQIRGRLERFECDLDAVNGARVRLASGEPVTLKATRYVLAAGWNNAELMRASVSHRGRAVSRTSWMLVAAAPHLPPLSLILPEHRFSGLFAVSRPVEGGQAWLVSNYLSLAYGHKDRHGASLWLNATLKTLGTLAPVLGDPLVRWGVYTAPKGELRAAPGVMAGHSWEGYGLTNLAVVSPTKLTLVPLLAEAAAEHVGQDLSPSPLRPEIRGERLPVHQERWRAERLVPIEELCDRHRIGRAAGHLASYTLA